jgi:glycogen debranching enzyme
MQSLAQKMVGMTTSAVSAGPSTAPAQTVYLLPLTDSGAPDVPGSYIYLPPATEPAYSVRFQIQGTSSICRQGSLWVNIPALGEKFKRSQYTEYKCVFLCSFPTPQASDTVLQTPARLQRHHRN